jgi:serine/threonine-protein kinase
MESYKVGDKISFGRSFQQHEYVIKDIKYGGMGAILIANIISGGDFVHRSKLAIKTIGSRFFSDNELQMFERELNIWILLEHSRILPLRAIYRFSNGLYALMPYCFDNLRDILIRERKLTLDHAIAMAIQIIEALDYAKSLFKIVHLDIKPENILCNYDHTDKKPSYLLSDWGIASIQNSYYLSGNNKDLSNNILFKTYNNFGTLPYMSPERLRGQTHSNIYSDVYSVGMILFETIAGHLPFDYKSSNIAVQILKGDYFVFAQHFLNQYGNKRLNSFITNCISPDFNERFCDYQTIMRELKRVKNPIIGLFG